METDGRYMMDNNYRYTLDLFEYCQTEEIPLPMRPVQFTAGGCIQGVANTKAR